MIWSDPIRMLIAIFMIVLIFDRLLIEYKVQAALFALYWAFYSFIFQAVNALGH